MISSALLPVLLAIGDVLKWRWPRVGITEIWATVNLTICNAIIKLVPGGYPSRTDPIDFVFGVVGSPAAYSTAEVWERTK